MIIDYIFNCPAETAFIELSPEIQEVIKSLGAEWPYFYMPGTHVLSGRKLLSVRMTVLLSKEQLDNMFSFYGLDWDVLSIRSAYKDVGSGLYNKYFISDPTLLLPYMDVNTGVVFLSTYFGTEPVRLI